MWKAAIEVSDAGLVYCEVSLFDTLWSVSLKKRGHFSLSVITEMSDGKCVDVYVLSLNTVKDVEFENKKGKTWIWRMENYPSVSYKLWKIIRIHLSCRDSWNILTLSSKI